MCRDISEADVHSLQVVLRIEQEVVGELQQADAQPLDGAYAAEAHEALLTHAALEHKQTQARHCRRSNSEFVADAHARAASSGPPQHADRDGAHDEQGA